MDNNANMNELIKKAQDMIKNNQIPDEVKQVVSNMSANPNNPISSTSQVSASNIDMNMVSNIMSKLNSQSSDDDMSRLLFALKPYLRNERKEKVDDYIKLIKMGKMAKLFESMGGDNK